MNMQKLLALAIIAVFTLSACATDEYGNKREMTDTEKGALIGAGIGVVAGLTTKDKGKKAALYGLIGGVSGAAVGHYMDSQKKDFELQLKNEIQSGAILVEPIPQNSLLVTMTAQTSFDVNSTQIKPGFYSTMDKISSIVNKYGKTHLSLVGHTDSTGSNAYNKTLSEQRAASVMSYLQSKGVIPQRLTAYGMGEDKPRASNTTEAGRAQNRRVEILIDPVIEPQN